VEAVEVRAVPARLLRQSQVDLVAEEPRFTTQEVQGHPRKGLVVEMEPQQVAAAVEEQAR
jgi:hypothetical protein